MKPLPNLNHIHTPPELKTDFLHFPSWFLSETEFMTRITKFTHIDVLTYSVSPHITNLRRVIYCEGLPPRTAESIRVSGTHIKLWLCYKHKCPTTLPEVFIGSANATLMTLKEIMHKTHPESWKHFQTYYEKLWSLNLPT
jgi:hypothetical protein